MGETGQPSIHDSKSETGLEKLNHVQWSTNDYKIFILFFEYERYGTFAHHRSTLCIVLASRIGHVN